ncbi:MAG: glycosyltransferase family 4 protein [Phycisphaerae bacterium]
MRILWHMPTLKRHTCGLSIRALRLAAELRSSGHDVVFTVDAARTDIDENVVNGFPIEKLDVPIPRILHWSIQATARRRKARAIVRRLSRDHDVFLSCQPEVVHAYHDVKIRRHHALSIPSRLGRLIGIRSNPVPKCIYVCGGSTLLHDSADTADQAALPITARGFHALDRYLKHRNESAGFRAADAIIFDSLQTRTVVVDVYRIDPDKCVTVHGGVDDAVFRPPDERKRAAARARLKIERDDFVVVWTGRMAPEKNLPLLIRATTRIRESKPRVWIVGDGPERDNMIRLARDEGVEALVSFTGSQSDVRPFLHAADCFCFPSRSESFGGSLVEAMACGLPCVVLAADGTVTRNAGEEIFGDPPCGVMVMENDPDVLAGAIEKLKAAPERRHRLGHSAMRRARARFTWSRGGRRLNDLLIRMLSDPIEDGPIRAARVVLK